MKILVFVEYYLPGYKSGGPVRSITNLVEHLGNEIKFKIITLDRDFSDTKSYRRIQVNSWNRVGKADVFYISPNKLSLEFLRKVMQSVEFDKIYLNGVFSYSFNIKPMILRNMRLIPMTPIIIAPRGQLSSGALGINRIKKQFFLFLAKFLNFYKGAIWHASNEVEETEVRRWFGTPNSVVTVPNLSPKREEPQELNEIEKYPGILKIVFISRISPKKNLAWALHSLKNLEGKIKFDIYGPIDDEIYWQECENTMNTLPKNVDANYIGPLPHDKVFGVLNNHHLFFLPTLGENFGHAILEAFMSGCPVLISDQTPWRDLEKKQAGWDISLSHPERFHQVLDHLVNMNNADFKKLAKLTKEYGLQSSRNEASLKVYRNLFHSSPEGKL
jgi:glycosyltransferase involved in cell wall biosynthesis